MFGVGDSVGGSVAMFDVGRGFAMGPCSFCFGNAELGLVVLLVLRTESRVQRHDLGGHMAHRAVCDGGLARRDRVCSGAMQR